jgi:hypothetical protein
MRFLVLLNLDVPQTLDALLFAVVVSFMSRCVAVDLGHSEREK